MLSKNNRYTIKLTYFAAFLFCILLVVLLFYGFGRSSNHDNEPIIPIEQLPSSFQSSSSTFNIVTPDWGIASTLVDMGIPPIATGDMRVWSQWVGRPELPDGIHDLGIRYQPNAELIAQLSTDLVLDNYFYEHARNLYGEVQSKSILFAAKNDVATWEDYALPTRKIGEIIHNSAIVEDYLARRKTQIWQAGERLSRRYPKVKKFAVVQFVDANHMRMYGQNSLFMPALEQMDKQLVALGKGNSWGFLPITLSQLSELEADVCLLVIEPLNPLTEAILKDNLIWQRLAYGLTTNESRCMAMLPPIWIYGGIPSLTRTADSLADATLIGGDAL